MSYDFRPRDKLRPPLRIDTLEPHSSSDLKREVAQANRKRTGKGTTINKTIIEINRIIEQRGSRTRLKFYNEVLKGSMQEAIIVHEELMVLIPEDSEDFNDEWIEDVTLKVNEALSNIYEYLLEREGDPPSSVCSTRSRETTQEKKQTLQDAIHMTKSHESQKLTTKIESWQRDSVHANKLRSSDHYTNKVEFPNLPLLNSYRDDRTMQDAFPKADLLNDEFDKISEDCNSRRNESRPSRRAVDEWIDDLDPYDNFNKQIEVVTSTDISLQLLAQQRLPRTVLLTFDGSPEQWIDFIVQFHEMVHLQHYLSDLQKKSYLVQHLKGDPNKAINGFSNDRFGYYSALKRLKYMFGQRASVAQAVLEKVTKGRPIPDHDRASLSDYYYQISNCLNTLQRMCYYADLRSTDVLRQAVKRLPTRFVETWCQHAFKIRKHEEPNLFHLEKWLQDKVMASMDPYLLDIKRTQKHRSYQQEDEAKKTSSFKVTTESGTTPQICSLCSGNHRLFKCHLYLEKGANERLELVKQKRLCFNCLKGHQVKKCTSKLNCFTPGCHKNHHTSLHDALMKEQKDKPNYRSDHTTKAHVGYTSDRQRWVYLQIVPMLIHGSHGEVMPTFALLDSGSQSTLIREDLATSLNLKGKKEMIKLGTIKDDGETMTVKNVSFKISSKDASTSLTVNEAYTIPKEKFKVPSQVLPTDFREAERWRYLRDLTIESISADDIKILIGADVPQALIAKEIRRGENSQPYAVKTNFGWSLMGAEKRKNDPSSTEIYQLRINQLRIRDMEIYSQMEKLWSTESFGTQYNFINDTSAEDTRAFGVLENQTALISNKYEVPMLWKNPNVNLPNNYSLAEKRLQPLIRRFQKDNELFKMYRCNIEEYLRLGYARKLSKDESEAISSKTWYLPHHAVTNPNKPGKVRTVFDAAAKYRGVSLNDSLITGPDLLNNLMGILLRFRTNKFAITADIESMFHQVKLDQVDKDSVRFLWKDDLESNDPPEQLQMLVHIFGAKDSPCCASYALQRTAIDNKNFYGEEVFNCVMKHFYMDDFIKSVSNEEHGLQLSLKLAEMLKRGGFRLTKFLSNSELIKNGIPESERSKSTTEVNIDEEHVERALGIKWHVKSDQFTFSSNITTTASTKRGILKATSSVFDPLGFLTPFTLRGKLIIQELWRRNCDWDEEIPEFLKYTWETWLTELREIRSIMIPRCYGDINDTAEVTLHIFCDASEKAFAAVSYIRIDNKQGGIKCRMIMSKTRLAPLKTLSLPRLELQAAVLAVRMKEFISKELGIRIVQVFYWTDSMITLQYIKNEDKRFKTFVANRVAEIREKSLPSEWRHIDGKLNPADLPTRGMKIIEMRKESIWFNGPALLYTSGTDWLTDDIGDLSDDSELKMKEVQINHANIVDRPLVDYERHSKWKRLVAIFGWIHRFIQNLKKKSKLTNLENAPFLSAEELSYGENILAKTIQREVYHDELQQDSCSSKSNLYRLDPCKDEQGLLRVGGRLRYALLPYAAKHQIILPFKHRAVELLLMHIHESHGHCGREYLLGILRQKFWVVNARQLAKHILGDCFDCKKRKSRPIIPRMADLPLPRLSIGKPPFYNCGVDYFGPIQVKILRRTVKRWGCLFTCMTTRAVHLEVAPSLETDAFINTLERFINRRGHPAVILSDCGTNFKGAERELLQNIKLIEQNKVGEFAARKGFEWRFNPPDAPHMGGAWERLIRSIKGTLKIIIQNQLVDDFTLLTLLTEVESILNSRPLTQMSSDENDLEALTPNHFLIGRASPNLSPGMFGKNDLSSRKKWRLVQVLTEHFWGRWTKEYLPTIALRSKWNDDTEPIAIGELVLIMDNNIPRGKWNLGRVSLLIPSKDNVTRAVEVKTVNGKYCRPVTKLCRLS